MFQVVFRDGAELLTFGKAVPFAMDAYDGATDLIGGTDSAQLAPRKELNVGYVRTIQPEHVFWVDPAIPYKPPGRPCGGICSLM